MTHSSYPCGQWLERSSSTTPAVDNLSYVYHYSAKLLETYLHTSGFDHEACIQSASPSLDILCISQPYYFRLSFALVRQTWFLGTQYYLPIVPRSRGGKNIDDLHREIVVEPDALLATKRMVSVRD